MLHEYNVDVAYDKFIEILCNAFKQCIPPRNTNVKILHVKPDNLGSNLCFNA